MEPSSYQRAIYDWVGTGRGDALVSARAGSGKTTVLVEAARRIGSANALMFAFNVHIKDELSSRLKALGSRVTALTVHGYGNRALRTKFDLRGPDELKYRKLAQALIMQRLEWNLSVQLQVPRLRVEVEKVIEARVRALTKLGQLARLTLADPTEPADLMDLLGKFDIGEVDGVAGETAILQALPVMLAEGASLITKGIIDFTDMIWGPLVLGVKPRAWDWALVDEAQDLSACARTLIQGGRGAGSRAMWVGDEWQAIMGFAGADADSFRAIQRATGATELPLSICYRCPTTHLNLAQRIVPDIEPRPDAPTGEVRCIGEETLLPLVKERALLLCRTTAPLIGWCMKMIRHKMPARVRGRDIGRGLCDMARQVERREPDFGLFVESLLAYTDQQVDALAQREGTEARIEALRDKCEALVACHDEFAVGSVQELCAAIDGIFADKDASIWLSTIHRAKGLEAEEVFIIKPELLPFSRPKMTADQRQQEWNLYYVALTRSKSLLTFVYGQAEQVPLSPVVTGP